LEKSIFSSVPQVLKLETDVFNGFSCFLRLGNVLASSHIVFLLLLFDKHMFDTGFSSYFIDCIRKTLVFTRFPGVLIDVIGKALVLTVFSGFFKSGKFSYCMCNDVIGKNWYFH
jgi:hypothetical protein